MKLQSYSVNSEDICTSFVVKFYIPRQVKVHQSARSNTIQGSCADDQSAISSVDIRHVSPLSLWLFRIVGDRCVLQWLDAFLFRLCFCITPLGVSRLYAVCVSQIADRRTTSIVDDRFCTDQPRPADSIRACNERQCPPEWAGSVYEKLIGNKIKSLKIFDFMRFDLYNVRSFFLAV